MTRKRAVSIGVDIGTSGCKAVVLASSGRVLHTAQATYPTRRTTSGESTQAPEHWLRAVARTLRECATEAEGHEVTGIGVTAPAHVAVLCDADGTPVERSLLAFDGRPTTIANQLREHYGEELIRRTFVRLSAGWTLPQLAWLHDQQPGLWQRVRWILTQKDWVRFRLTGVALIDATDAAGTAMMDQRERAWIEPVCRDLGVSEGQLPPIVDSTESGGRLTPEWSHLTGLAVGTPVVVGATDTAAELVSVGADEAGGSLVKIASTGTVVCVTDEPKVDQRLLTYPHAVPGQWYTLAATNTATVAYQWLRETVFTAEAKPGSTDYRHMNRRASRVPAGSAGLLFLPYLSGERTPYWDSDLRAAFVGLSGGHGREHLARAVLEGVALALRDCRDVMDEVGLAVKTPHLAGGGMRSRLWRTILVSALGLTGTVTSPQGPAVGAAMLASAEGNGITSASLGRRRRTLVEPVPEWVTAYDGLYDTYSRAAAANMEISHRLVGLASQPASNA